MHAASLARSSPLTQLNKLQAGIGNHASSLLMNSRPAYTEQGLAVYASQPAVLQQNVRSLAKQLDSISAGLCSCVLTYGTAPACIANRFAQTACPVSCLLTVLDSQSHVSGYSHYPWYFWMQKGCRCLVTTQVIVCTGSAADCRHRHHGCSSRPPRSACWPVCI